MLYVHIGGECSWAMNQLFQRQASAGDQRTPFRAYTDAGLGLASSRAECYALKDYVKRWHAGKHLNPRPYLRGRGVLLVGDASIHNPHRISF